MGKGVGRGDGERKKYSRTKEEMMRIVVQSLLRIVAYFELIQKNFKCSFVALIFFLNNFFTVI